MTLYIEWMNLFYLYIMLTKEQKEFLLEYRETLEKLLPLKEEQLKEKKENNTDEEKIKKDKERILKLVNSMTNADILALKKIMEGEDE